MNTHTLLIEQALVTMMTTETSGLADRELFEGLRTAVDAESAQQLEDRIWTRWCSHADESAEEAMVRVMHGFEDGDLAAVGHELDAMVDRWPEWSEAWNKRATLRFIEDRDLDSLEDIVRTLALEPRHFGAMGGLGQICLRAGDGRSALLCFEQVLSIYPTMATARQVVETLQQESPEFVQ